MRYADDWLILVAGTREHAEPAGRGGGGTGPDGSAPVGAEDEDHPHRRGPRLLGWRIQRHRKRGTNRHYVYTYPARKAVQAVTGKVKDLCRRIGTNQPLEVLLLQLNWLLRGWCAYFRPGVSSATFNT